ncbi:class I SAM-dependent methyltransferase [Kitasatospora sp. NPDC088134]|uniref:class I SAM-dependent methyltransferase n=1 Tax=Kitasatospora sp. NPDC088134 TaxID=3364071 RepID=UPI0038293596
MDDNLTGIAAYWNTAAPAFDREPDHGLGDGTTRAAWERRLAGWVPDGPSDVLDVGCGTGSLALLLARRGHRVTGVDLAPRMLELATAKLAAAGLPARFLLGDAALPPTGEERFDVLLCRHLLWTLPDPGAALRAWTARLRPGGTLVLIEGRWRESAAPDDAPYAAGADRLPWHGGVTATTLVATLRPLVADLRIDPLDGEPELWGHPVDDERYAVVARV